MRQKQQENQLNTGTSEEEDIYEHLYGLIKGCIFEDGMSNVAIDYLKKVYKNNPEEVAYLISVISEYDAEDPEIIGGLCRCLCWLGDYDNLDPLVKKHAAYFLEDCIQSKNAYCQESAIMLCEEWETAMCLDLLVNKLQPCDKFITQYANDVIKYLSKNVPR